MVVTQKPGDPDGDVYVVDDPSSASNDVLYPWAGATINNNINVSWSLPEPIADGETGTLYFRYYMSGLDVSCSIGVHSTPGAEVTGWGAYKSMLRLPGAIRDGSFEVRDSGNYYTTNHVSQTGVWYEVWLVVDNANDLSRCYIRGGQHTEVTEIVFDKTDGTTSATDFLFRGGATDAPMTTATVVIGSGDTAQGYYGTDFLFLDDLYLASGEVLCAPGEDCASANTWAGWTIDGDGNVDTGDFMQWLYIDGDWVWSYRLNKWVYLPENFVQETGAWTWVTR